VDSRLSANKKDAGFTGAFAASMEIYAASDTSRIARAKSGKYICAFAGHK
jgi:hypothetical protein